MQLGTQTASLVNHLQSRSVIGQPEPVVGMGATILMWTDRKGATIEEVFSVGTTVYIKVREDHAVRIDKNGMSESQDYTFMPNPTGSESTFKREADGTWVQVTFNTLTKRYKKLKGYGLRIGARSAYHDYSF